MSEEKTMKRKFPRGWQTYKINLTLSVTEVDKLLLMTRNDDSEMADYMRQQIRKAVGQ